MLKKFNTKETWIDVETLANLKGVSKRAIRLSFNSKNSNYETKIENGKGGKVYKIRLSSIEEELQIKYIHEYYDTLSTTNNIIELHNFEPKAEKIISFKQRELVQSVPSPKAEPVKLWLARVGYERMKEMADPSTAIDRARETYQKLGRSEK